MSNNLPIELEYEYYMAREFSNDFHFRARRNSAVGENDILINGLAVTGFIGFINYMEENWYMGNLPIIKMSKSYDAPTSYDIWLWKRDNYPGFDEWLRSNLQQRYYVEPRGHRLWFESPEDLMQYQMTWL